MAGSAAGGTTTAPNINQMAAQGIRGAGLGTASGMGYNPQQVQAGQLATTSMTPYMNPYTTDVIKASEQDILRGAGMGLNTLGAQAQAARSFGGSRHGVAMGELGRGTLDQLAQSSAGLRQQGYQQAQQAAQSDIANRMNADQFNVSSGLQGQQQRLGAAGQLADISNLGFGMGQTVTQNLATQGAQQQALQQALIDIAKQRYGQYTGHPVQGLGYATQALGAAPVPETKTTTKQNGLFDYLTLGASVAPTLMQYSDERLKTNIVKMGKLKSGLNIYKWDWIKGAKELGANMNHTMGVLAQEVKEIFPDAVILDASGYYKVNYGAINGKT